MANAEHNAGKVDRNILNAFQVVYRTYQSVDKMFAELDEVCLRSGYVVLTPRFMRWKSDMHPGGWLVGSFIKLYQRKEDPRLRKGQELRNGPIFGVEVSLLNTQGPLESLDMLVAKYEYEDDYFRTWDRAPSVAEHWGFYHPLRDAKRFQLSEANGVWKSVPADDAVKDEFWGLRQARFVRRPLLDITGKEQIREQIVIRFAEL